MNLPRFHIDDESLATIRTKLRAVLDGQKYMHVVTLNPEIILRGATDIQYHKIIMDAFLRLPDGVGLHLYQWRLGKQLHYRYTGVELMMDVLSLAEKSSTTVALVAHKEGLTSWKKCAKSIRAHYPKICLVGCDILPGESSMCYRSAKIVLCNFGAPDQEHFLAHLKDDKIESLRLGIGVGGAFDFIAGTITRAPRWMRAIGMEWFYRLVQQPCRVHRIARATLVFPWKVLFGRIL